MATETALPPDLWDAAANPEGIVANRFFTEGAGVRKGATVAEIMVEKTSFDIAAPADGHLHIAVGKGGVVKPGAVIGTVDGGQPCCSGLAAVAGKAFPTFFSTGVRTFSTAQAGLERQEWFGEDLTPDDTPILMAWQAPRALIVGRSNARLPGFARAAEELAAEGWPVLVRRSGGSACPVSPGTLQIALVRASAGQGEIEAGYRTLASVIETLLSGVSVLCEAGERPGAFCPGRYDLGVGPRKFAGLSQHWRSQGSAIIISTAA